MTTYLAQRAASAVITLMIVSILVFVILRVVPGDVATLILQGPDGAGSANAQDVAKLNQQLGLDRPLPVQYLDWARHLLSFDLGQSLWTKGSILHELKAR